MASPSLPTLRTSTSSSRQLPSFPLLLPPQNLTIIPLFIRYSLMSSSIIHPFHSSIPFYRSRIGYNNCDSCRIQACSVLQYQIRYSTAPLILCLPLLSSVPSSLDPESGAGRDSARHSCVLTHMNIAPTGIVYPRVNVALKPAEGGGTGTGDVNCTRFGTIIVLSAA